MTDYYTGNRYLTEDEMKVNAAYIYTQLTPLGWTRNAIAGMLGNMETESTINPAIWQNLDMFNYDGGYGLVQWTPATKFLDWCEENGLNPATMPAALKRLEYELANGLQYYPTDEYPLTFEEFKRSTKPAEYLGMAFLANYERPADPNQPARGEQAEKWFEYLGGSIEPETSHRKQSKMPLWLLVAAARR